MNTVRKPLGTKNYGHIPHLPGSRMGPGDHACHVGQARICTEQPRDRYDRIIVQEKLDGSNVGVAKIAGEIVALTKAGYAAITSPYPQHYHFALWVAQHSRRFDDALDNGERLIGEWLLQAHGTRYRLTHEPFVVIDMFRHGQRLLWENIAYIGGTVLELPLPACVAREATGIVQALDLCGRYGHHGALDPIEGCVWRVERERVIDKSGRRGWHVDFLAKYVRPDKIDGVYLPNNTGKSEVWNEIV